MNKIYITLFLIASTALLKGQEYPTDALMPSIKEYEISEDMRNPFLETEKSSGSSKEAQFNELSVQFRKSIIGYVESNERSKSYIQTNDSIVKVGGLMRLTQDPALSAKLTNITGTLIHFEKDGVNFSVDMKQDYFVREKLIARGIIVHPDGWILANTPGLDSHKPMYVYLNDIAFPVKLVTSNADEGIGLFKLYNEHRDLKLPYIAFSTKEPKEGDVLYVQEHFGQKMPYMRQVVLDEGLVSPDVTQLTSAATLNENLELIGFFGNKSTRYGTIQSILEGLPPVKTGTHLPCLDKASVTIINE